MALVNFNLKHPDNIISWSDSPEAGMQWFALTDGEYWLDVNKAMLYEYTTEVLAGLPAHESHYVEYAIARLLEDWTGIFESMAEPLPDAFYAISRSNNYLYRFYEAAQNWFDNSPKDPSMDAAFYYDSYDKAIEWIYSRTLTAMHLTGGPGISFFRNRNHISIVWKADHLTETHIPVWTAQNGEVEMDYEKFVHEIEDFGNRFFQAMDTQIQIVTEREQGAATLSKEHLIQEQQERRTGFQQKLSVLKSTPARHTDWDVINSVITTMFG